jgi:UPF0176 protein
MSNQDCFTNIAYYKFVDIEDPASLQKTLLKICNDLNLKGTILLAHEGINSCLAGKPEDIDKYIETMHQNPLFEDVEFKKSTSTHKPFRRMLVKIKKETIPMGISTVNPAKKTGKYVSALEFKQWLYNGEDVVVLDTRNDYEVALGTFHNAIDPKLKEFREFPQWIKDNFTQYKNKKVVTFCTGGIRCEKASEFMRQEGFEDVYQIQGGILKYLEETSKKAPGENNHYDGDCFVFDYRVAVDKNLNQTNYTFCHNCWTTLKPEDLQSSNYKQGTYCPHCADRYHAKQEKIANTVRENNVRALQVRIERAAQIRASLGK